MQLNNYGSRVDLLADWISTASELGDSHLEIGASDGSFCPELEMLSRNFMTDGVDPDYPALTANPRLRRRYGDLLEEAEIPPASYHAAYAIYVAEHVENPGAFIAAAHRVLKPGGSLFLITPNGNHYFAIIAKFLDRTKLQERVLRLIRPAELVDRYHHSAHYRLNKPSVIRRLAERHGFESVEFRFSERYDEFVCYFPGPTKLLPRAWEWYVERTGKEHLLGNLMVRMVKGR